MRHLAAPLGEIVGTVSAVAQTRAATDDVLGGLEVNAAFDS